MVTTSLCVAGSPSGEVRSLAQVSERRLSHSDLSRGGERSICISVCVSSLCRAYARALDHRRRCGFKPETSKLLKSVKQLFGVQPSVASMMDTTKTPTAPSQPFYSRFSYRLQHAHTHCARTYAHTHTHAHTKQ